MGGSYVVMKSNPRVIGDRPLISIGYKYNCMKVLVFIATERNVGTEPGDPCLSRFPVMYSNVYVLSVFFPRFLGNNFDACNVIYNHNSMRQSDLAVDKYLMTQSGYLKLAAEMELGVGITKVASPC